MTAFVHQTYSCGTAPGSNRSSPHHPAPKAGTSIASVCQVSLYTFCERLCQSPIAVYTTMGTKKKAPPPGHPYRWPLIQPNRSGQYPGGGALPLVEGKASLSPPNAIIDRETAHLYHTNSSLGWLALRSSLCMLDDPTTALARSTACTRELRCSAKSSPYRSGILRLRAQAPVLRLSGRNDAANDWAIIGCFPAVVKSVSSPSEVAWEKTRDCRYSKVAFCASSG
jgi:hypothetical protein